MQIKLHSVMTTLLKKWVQILENFLNLIRRKAKSKRELGELFERAIMDFLKKSPEHDFENVWMRKDWPDLEKYGLSKKDLGIDLIAKEKETGKYWAIQCKCYDENYQVNKSDIDSFLLNLVKNHFQHGLLLLQRTTGVLMLKKL